MSEASHSPHTPIQIGPFELLEPIARGGMGVVYRARDPRADREIALKLLAPGGNATGQERLLREARALARLRHPNVVQVHDVGASAHGPYLALELIPGGRTLTDRIVEEGTLSPREATRIAAVLADALQACHDAGVLHRDVKPSNVLIAADGRLVLTDFGLALQSGDSLARLSQTGAVLGTPGFFAPEQALGKPGAIDERVDIYGLGATLFALLTGHAPVEGTTLAEVVIATRNRDATPPSDSRPDLDPALDQLVLRCLARDPAQRFASASELADALRAYDRGELRSTRPRWPWIVAGAAALLFVGVLVQSALFDAQPVAVPPPAASPATSSGPPEFDLSPPHLGAGTRLRCRFEQTYRSAARRQILRLEIISAGKVTQAEPTLRIDGRVTRVLGRIADPANDLRFDSGDPTTLGDSARILVGDLLAWIDGPLTMTFRLNQPELTLVGLSPSAKLGTATFDPIALASRRLAPGQACFPLPPTASTWEREFSFHLRSASQSHRGQLRLHCRRPDAADPNRIEFHARSEDARWLSTPNPVTSFALDGRMTAQGGWIRRATIEVTYKARHPDDGPYTFVLRTLYELEVAE